MKETAAHNEKIAKLRFASVYPHYVNKVKGKGRSVEELHAVIKWLCGINEKQLEKFIQGTETFEELFAKVDVNPLAAKIKGSICGYKIEEIQNPLTKKVRYLDKLVDDLAKGKELDKILFHTT